MIRSEKKKPSKEMKQIKSFKKVNKNIEELSTMVNRDIKELTETLKKASKIKGRQKLQTLDQLRRKDFKALKNLINSFQIAIATEQAENEQSQLTQFHQQHNQFEKALQKFRRDIDFYRTEKVREEQVYAERAAAAQTTKQQYEFKIEAAQKQSELAVKNMLKMLYQTNEIANTVNIQLQRQISQLDNVGENIRDTESVMNRAMRHINYFARSIYTDKLLLALMILILLAVVAIVILNIMGKVSTSNQDKLV